MIPYWHLETQAGDSTVQPPSTVKQGIQAIALCVCVHPWAMESKCMPELILTFSFNTWEFNEKKNKSVKTKGFDVTWIQFQGKFLQQHVSNSVLRISFFS